MGKPKEVTIRIPVTRDRRKRRFSLVRLVFIAVLTYVGVCIFARVFQTRLIYFPSQGYDSSPADIGLAFEDLTLKTDDGVSIAAWYVPHPQARGTILFCHGNAGNISDRLFDVKEFHSLGFNVLIFDYRGYGRSSGSPNEVGTYVDAETAWRFLTQTVGEPAQRIVLFGRSLGGAVAIELAHRHTPAALVVESTFTNLVDVGRVHYRYLPVDWLLTNRYDSLSKVGQITCPKLFAHGLQDKLIPFELGRQLYNKAASPKRFMETPGGHNLAGITYSDEHKAILAEFLTAAVSM
ncbi:MAG: alpha/beta hydrolase [Phycisphaerales bacterium]|nr:MAG: alpha/beta hydrolase [Phycisphaerales bacterium]